MPKPSGDDIELHAVRKKDVHAVPRAVPSEMTSPMALDMDKLSKVRAPRLRSRSPHSEPPQPQCEALPTLPQKMPTPRGGPGKLIDDVIGGSRWCQCARFKPDHETKDHRPAASPMRWVMLAVLSLDICISYIPYYTFVPIPRQSMQVYGVDEAALNVLCILYALVFVPAAFVTGPIVSSLGCRWTFILAMALNALGCAVRCGFLNVPYLILLLRAGHDTQPEMSMSLIEPVMAVSSAAASGVSAAAATALAAASPLGRSVPVMPEVTSFWWLVIGQALCALGQPLLINSTCDLGVDWFQPHERPTAAMVSNLMNFVGSSLSFILPPLIVQETPASLQDAEREIGKLLRVQFWLAIAGLVLTFCVYGRVQLPKTKNTERATATYAGDVYLIFKSRDFWLVNGYFSVFIALCHAFDAVEGSLLERYGYSASLSAWTAVSCSVGSIISTMLEASCIKSATAYRPALLFAAGFLCLSQVMCWACLNLRLHSGFFVLGVGVMGLCTPGWGCSCELGAEVSFPAREATTSSVLEAFSNLAGVFAIILVQSLLDSGFGCSVLAMMAGAALFGGSLALCLSGHLPRTEAEEREAAADAAAAAGSEMLRLGDQIAAEESAKAMAAKTSSEQRDQVLAVEDWWKRWWTHGGRRVRILGALVFLLLFACLCMLLLVLPASQLPEDLGSADVPNQMPGQSVVTKVQAGQRSSATPAGAEPGPERVAPPGNRPTTLSVAVVDKVENVVISCSTKRLARFRRLMTRTGLTFRTVPCFKGTLANVRAAVADKLIGKDAERMDGGISFGGKVRLELLGEAISHLRLLQNISAGTAEMVNVFTDREAMWPTYRDRRFELLTHLPGNTDMVKLDVKQPAGRKVKIPRSGPWMIGHVFRMAPTLSPTLNIGMTNYIISKQGALKLLRWSRNYDTSGRWETFDQFLLSKFYKESKIKGHFVGFTVTASAMSLRCDDHNITHNRKTAELCRGDP